MNRRLPARANAFSTGLPFQSGLTGTVLSSTTTYAYSASSPVLAAYERELVNRLSNCP